MAVTRRSLAASVLGIAGSALGGCNLGTRTIRYRLRVEVATPDGVSIGAGVMEETVQWSGATLGAGPGLIINRRAEAVAVNLGSRGSFFCLLTGDSSRPESMSMQPLRSAFPIEQWSAKGWFNFGEDAYLTYLDNLIERHPTAVVPSSRLPLLVRFHDIANPKTIERVEPEYLWRSFGRGTSIENASLEVTTDSVTTGIERILPWLDHLSIGSITGMTEFDPGKPDPVNYLPPAAFRERIRR